MEKNDSKKETPMACESQGPKQHPKLRQIKDDTQTLTKDQTQTRRILVSCSHSSQPHTPLPRGYMAESRLQANGREGEWALGGALWPPCCSSLLPSQTQTPNQTPDPDPQTTDPAPEGRGGTSPPPPKPSNPGGGGHPPPFAPDKPDKSGAGQGSSARRGGRFPRRSIGRCRGGSCGHPSQIFGRQRTGL